ncbi:class I SAM-dependent methyltransferase [Nocardia sp. NPDC052566]|uniref:class I SAM-dependent methyltransferase n=1 Tax=Nocardia sp. NPDC052566 TaxID=3364330 RepID=UPI0037C95B6E
MQPITVDVTGSQATAFLSLYLRWLDSRDHHSMLDDAWADAALRNLDFDFAQFHKLDYARFTVAARTRLLDEWVGRYLADNPDAVVLDMGSGFDSRVFRIDPGRGHHWYDVDFPNIIEARNRLYPARPGHTTIGASVADPEWLDEIPGDRPVIAIADSILMFLTPDQVRTTFRQIIDHFPCGEVVFTTYSSLVERRQTKGDRSGFFEKYNVELKWTLDDPRELAQVDPRLRFLDRRSQMERRLHRGAPLYDHLLCAFISAFPWTRYSAAILRCGF